MFDLIPTRLRTGPPSARTSPRRWLSASVWLPVALVVFGCCVVVPASVTAPLVGLLAAGMVALLALVLAVGTDRASTTMLVLAFLFAPLTNFGLGMRPLVFASALFAVSVGLVLPRLLRRRLRLPPLFVVGSVLFTIMGIAASPRAADPGYSFIYLMTAVIALAVIPAFVVWLAPTLRQIYYCAVAFGIGTAASTLYGLPKHDYRNYGFTYHPVALAYTAMLALSLVPFMLRSGVRGRWLIVPPVAAVALVGAWTSGSRTDLVVLAALAVVVPVLERSIRWGLAVATGFVLLLPSVLTYDPTNGSTSALSRLFGAGGATNSDTTRLSTLHDGLEQIQANPALGNGYSIDHTYVIHDLYLQVLAAEGAIGLIGLLLMLGVFVVPLRRASAPMRCLAYPALAVILAGPFQPNMGDHYLGLSLGLALIAAVGVMSDKDDSGDADPVSAEPVKVRSQPRARITAIGRGVRYRAALPKSRSTISW